MLIDKQHIQGCLPEQSRHNPLFLSPHLLFPSTRPPLNPSPCSLTISSVEKQFFETRGSSERCKLPSEVWGKASADSREGINSFDNGFLYTENSTVTSITNSQYVFFVQIFFNSKGGQTQRKGPLNMSLLEIVTRPDQTQPLYNS